MLHLHPSSSHLMEWGHGLAHAQRLGTSGPGATTARRQPGRGLPQRHDHPPVRRGPEQGRVVAGLGVLDLHHRPRAQGLSPATGLAGLLPVKPPGRPSRATPEFRAAMAEAVQTPPQALGYGFTTWLPRLAAHLKKVTGIGFSDDQLRRLLHRHGYSVQRPKHTMKGKRDEAAYQQAAEELEALEKKAIRRQRLGSPDLPGRSRNPSPPDALPDLGPGRLSNPQIPAPGQNEKTGGLWRSRLRYRPDHLHDRADQVRDPTSWCS